MVQIQVTFEIGTDVDQAALNVNNRVKQAEPRLPQEVRRQGVTVEKGSLVVPAGARVLLARRPLRRPLHVSNYVTLNVLDAIKRVPGTTNVQIFGAKDYAMRIWLRPDRLAQLKLTTADVIRALNEQNAQFAAGKVGQAPTGGAQELVYTITTKGRLVRAAGVREHHRARQPGRLGAAPEGRGARRARLARTTTSSAASTASTPTLVGIFLQPGANALEVGEDVQASRSNELAQALSRRASTYSVPYDTTRFVEVSIREVVNTLVEAMVLVFLVVFLFLQNWRATLIPFAAVPVSLIGTFAGLLLLGYSINTLTLFGMVLAIGIVVDDAIVVLENVERIMHEEHLAAREAAIKAMQRGDRARSSPSC